MQIKKPYVTKPKQGQYFWGTFWQYCLNQAIPVTDADLDLRNPYTHELVKQYQREQDVPLPVQQVSPGFSFVVDDSPTPPWDALILGQRLANARDKFLDACNFGAELKAYRKSMRRLRKRKNYAAHNLDSYHSYVTDAEYLRGKLFAKRAAHWEELCS